MGRVLVNALTLAYTIETSLGVLPGSPTWKLLEPNTIGSFGANITTTAREPISKDRQRQKSTVTDLDSSVEFEHDLTREVFEDFMEGFIMASTRYPYCGGTTRRGPIQGGTSFDNLAADGDAGGDSFTHDTITTAMTQNRLLYARGFSTAANNGLHVVDAGSTATVTEVTTTNTLVDETPTDVDNATLEIAGHRGATADITWTQATKTIGSTTLDFTTLGLSPGQVIHIGGLTSTTQFAQGVAYARIVSIAANAIVVDKVSGTLAADDTGSGKQIDLLYGGFLRNVPIDDSDFLEQSYQFEGTLPNLDNPSGDMYEYAIGNYANQATFNLPLADKATISFGFVGKDVETPVDTQKTGASTPVETVQTEPFNTSADIVRLRATQTDETALTSCFKNLTVTFNNQANPEKCLATLGASYMNVGLFQMNLEGQILLTDANLITAIRNNETLTMDYILKNNDGALCVDVPSMTMASDGKDLPLNESVILNTNATAFKDATLGYSVGVSTIPAVP